MSVKFERRLVSAIQRILAAGPVGQDDLLAELQKTGLRVEPGHLWEVCRTHGLADLRDRTWVPHGWAASIGAASDPEPTVSRPAAEVRAEQRAHAHVRRMMDALGVPTVESVPPVGPVPAQWHEVAKTAARALMDELNTASTRRTQTDVPLVDGLEAGRAGAGRLVRFEAQDDIGAAEGTPAELIVNKWAYEAEVVSVFGSVVTLSVPLDFPHTATAHLRLDLSWLLRLQGKRFQELIDGGAGFNAEAALAVGTADFVNRLKSLVTLAPTAAAGLNDGQRRAVELGLAEGVTWLWGPPGTGKTTTLSALIGQLAVRGLRVLLAAPTNAALDVAVKAVLKDRPDMAGGRLVRLGQPADASLVDRAEGRVLADEIAAEQGGEIPRTRNEVGQALRQCRSELAQLRRKTSLAPADERRRRVLEQRSAEYSALYRELNRGMMEVRRHVCRQADVVAATAHQVVLETLRELTFDVVILDEASMTSAALAMLVAGSGKGHTVIAGDFRQLPPIAQADTPAAQLWLHHSPFERAGIMRAVADGRNPQGLAALTEQYRMRDDIGHVVSTAFYPESPLRTAEVVYKRHRRSRASWARSELIVLDTSELMPRTARRQGFQSRYNVTHVQLLAALLGAAEGIEDLALITPFAPQARLLESLLPSERADQWAASTVHRFQGGERDIVVYDTVDTGYGVKRLHEWFTDGYAESDGARLLNVAASRARDHLVVIGALKSLHRRGADRDAVWTFFAHLLDRAMPLSLPAAVNQSNITEVVTTNLTERLRDDLSTAEVVDMWLPRGAPVHLPALLPTLRHMPKGRLNTESVTIWIEPEADGHLPAEALHAKREGVNVRPASPVLESFAVIGSTVWSSTDPLLGSRPGVVLRTAHSQLADAVRRAQRRRSGPAPGSGELGENCGRCQRMLIRYEVGRRGTAEVSHKCSACDRLAPVRRGWR